MKRLTTFAMTFGLAFVAALSAAAPARGETLAYSSFASSAEGWWTYDEVIPGSFKYVPTGGWDANGYVTATDDNTGGSWWFQAPAKFYRRNEDNPQGYQGNPYGGAILFYLRPHSQAGGDITCEKPSSYTDQFWGDVVIQDRDGLYTLYHNFSSVPPLEEWTKFTVPLTESEWVYTQTEKRPSKLLFQRVLSSLGKLLIRGEYYECADSCDLDYVYLTDGGPTRAPRKTPRRARPGRSK